MNPNAMTQPEKARVVTKENRAQAEAEKLARKGVYKRLMKNDDFKVFYEYLETCYNSYIESGGDPRVEKHTSDRMLYDAATFHKILKYIERQAKP